MKILGDRQAFLQRSIQSLSALADSMEALPRIALSSLPPQKTLIVSIDMNNGFAKSGALSSPRVGALCADTGAFLQHCIRQGYEVLPFTDCHQPDAVEFSGYPPHCIDGTEESRLVDELAMVQEQVRPKNCTNAFLAVEKDWTAYDQVVVTGCCTDICVYQFAVTLKAYYNQKNLSRRVIVPLELTATFDAPGHDGDLMEVVFASSMLSNGVEVVAGLTR